MSLYAALAAATLLACEVALRLPFGRIVAALNSNSWRAVEVVGSAQISDHWKERILPVYAWRILKASLGLFACLAAIVAPLVLVMALVTGSVAAASALLMRPLALLLMTGVGVGYVWLRLRRARGDPAAAAEAAADPAGTASDYSALDRTLHKVVLGNPMMAGALPRLDAAFARKPAPAGDPVYVTGLARAGTTVLMQALYGSGQFASLTYADMPFVLAPNLWATLTRSGHRKGAAKERAHGDGVMVDFDSPEALEEVFWRSRCGSAYIHNNGLVPHVPDAATIAAYRDYQARVCHRHRQPNGAPRYLAKNNNLMLRIGPLAAAMPEARFLVPVRDPVGQAASLLAQHRRFRRADAFTRSYMTWLVHHEFGPDQRPFRLPGQPVPEGDSDKLAYWLTEWLACYGYLAERIAEHPDRIRPVIYESLGRDPGAWPAVAAFAGLDPVPPADFRPAPPPPDPGDLPADLLARARAVYEDLARRAAA